MKKWREREKHKLINRRLLWKIALILLILLFMAKICLADLLVNSKTGSVIVDIGDGIFIDSRTHSPIVELGDGTLVDSRTGELIIRLEENGDDVHDTDVFRLMRNMVEMNSCLKEDSTPSVPLTYENWEKAFYTILAAYIKSNSDLERLLYEMILEDM